MFVDDPLDSHQSDPGAFELLLAVEALKNAEKLSHILRIEADAIVTDEDYRLRSAGHTAYLDHCMFPRTGELDSIGEEIE